MKQKILVGGLCLSLALSLVSCGGQQTGQEPQEPKQEIQQTEPVTTEPTTEPMEVKQEVKTTGATSEPVEGEQDTGNEVDPAGTVGEVEPVVELFTEVNEVVYATGTVNLRSGPSTNDDKVGALSKGQSVTRTGIGTGDYSSWSRVKLSDGSEVYVASSYLSTTKPSTGSSSQQGGGKTQTPSSGQQQGQQQQSGDIYGGEFNIIDPWAGMTPEEKAAQQEADRQHTEQIISETQGTMH